MITRYYFYRCVIRCDKQSFKNVSGMIQIKSWIANPERAYLQVYKDVSSVSGSDKNKIDMLELSRIK